MTYDELVECAAKAAFEAGRAAAREMNVAMHPVVDQPWEKLPEWVQRVQHAEARAALDAVASAAEMHGTAAILFALPMTRHD